MKTIQITNAGVIKQIVEAAGLQKDGFIVGSTDPVAADGKLKYAILKNIGATLPNIKGVVLVAEIEGVAESFKGIIGTLYRLRGAVDAFLIAEQYTVTCLKAYTQDKFESGDSEIKVGRCAYKGKTYIGFNTKPSPSPRLFYSGLYSGNCLFTHVPESEVTWL